jgi:hypothetical protein
MGPKRRAFWRLLSLLGAFMVMVAFAGYGPAVQDEPSPEFPCTAPSPRREDLRALDRQVEPFPWPATPELPSRSEVLQPKALGLSEWPDFRAELVSDAYRGRRVDPAADIGDTLLRVPELLIDGTFACIGGLSKRPPLRTSEDEENRSVTGRLFDVQSERRQKRLFSVFIQQWAESEKSYLGEFEESRANTLGFQNRTENADLDELALDQRKVFWDALRRTYLARYMVHSEEQIREEAWYLDRWSGVDFVALPPFIGAYLFFRGYNRKIPMGDLALRLSFEPVSQLIDRNHDRPVAAALEWTATGFPVGVIVSVGITDGRYGVDFAGIGTSIGSARRAVQGTQESRSR